VSTVYAPYRRVIGVLRLERPVEQRPVVSLWGYQAPFIAALGEALRPAGCLEGANHRGGRAFAAVSTRNGALRHGFYGSSARAPRVMILQRSGQLNPLAGKPGTWPRSWGCARSWPTVTTASVPYWRGSADRSQSALSSPRFSRGTGRGT
jgi:hypothetical protein